MEYPLTGVRVLDCSRVLAGPFAGRMLASLGADVVKVEPPEGDVSRLWGVRRAGLSGYYTAQNSGKRNICVDLKSDEGRELVIELARAADILIENFRPGVMTRLGLGWDVLSRANPALIMLSISGYGQSGPESQRAAYAPILHAESGLLARQSEMDGFPARDTAVSLGDTNAGLHGLVGVLAALHLRQRTGQGQHVDLGMFDAMLATDDRIHFALDDAPIEQGASEVWDAASGPIIIAGDFRYVWHVLSQRGGVSDPTPAGASLAEKIAARRAAAAEFFRSFETREKLGAALDQMNLAWGSVRSAAEALDAPSVAARRIVVDVDDRAGGTRRMIQAPYRFSNAQSGIRSGAPHRGEHNGVVLGEWLELPEAEVERLVAVGVLQSES